MILIPYQLQKRLRKVLQVQIGNPIFKFYSNKDTFFYKFQEYPAHSKIFYISFSNNLKSKFFEFENIKFVIRQLKNLKFGGPAQFCVYTHLRKIFPYLSLNINMNLKCKESKFLENQVQSSFVFAPPPPSSSLSLTPIS